jgi:DNA-binding CsgD family transcriptional regulator
LPPVLDLGERLAVRRARSLQDLARELSADALSVSTAVAQHLLHAEERLVDPDDPTLAALVEPFVDSTVGAMLAALAFGMPADAARPTEASLALFERLAERDDGLAVALRAHRLLAAELWQTWAAFTDERVPDRRAHSALLSASTRRLDAHLDRVCEYLTAAWADTRRRRLRGVDVPVAELLNRALCGEPEAAAGALAQLGYPADGLHLAIALPVAVDAEPLSRRLRLACGATVLAGDATIWISLTRSTSAEAVERARPLLDHDGPVGIGDACPGLEGFRRTRRQAADALHIALLDDAPGATRYRDVALLAVLCADESRARELARVELGPLAGDDEVAVRLRDTVSAYLAAGESQVATAQRLFIHQKTVKYRLRQAEELLGRTIGERRSELAAALMVHRALTR